MTETMAGLEPSLVSKKNPPSLRSRNTAIWTGTAFLLMTFFLLLGVGAASSTAGRIATLIPVALLAGATFRAYRSATLLIRGDTVVARTLIKTRRFPMREVQSFSTEVGQVGLYQRAYLVLGMGASAYRFREINVAPGREAELRTEADRLTSRLGK